MCLAEIGGSLRVTSSIHHPSGERIRCSPQFFLPLLLLPPRTPLITPVLLGVFFMPEKPRTYEHKFGKTKMKDPDLQRAQAAVVVAKRIAGHSIREIADDLGITPESVNLRMEWAKKEGLIEDARQRIINELVPLAVNTFRDLIKDGDYDAARDVLFGTGILRKDSKSAEQVEELTLTAWREQRTRIDENGSGQGALPPVTSRDPQVFSEGILATDGQDDHPGKQGAGDAPDAPSGDGETSAEDSDVSS
jgi:hypothetical protein